jgi:hypothetical protein
MHIDDRGKAGHPLGRIKPSKQRYVPGPTELDLGYFVGCISRR